MHHKKTAFLFLCSLSAFSLLTFDLYQPALPTITTYFNTTHALGQLTLSLFFFIFGLSQLIWGPLIDHYGRRKILNVSFYIFIVATLGCMLAPNIELLILARSLQGFAVCCCNVVAFSCTRDEEDSTARARLISYISMIVSVSPIFAPLLGSIIFVYFGWRAIFLFMVLLGLSLLILAHHLLHESPYWKRSTRHISFKASLLTYLEILTHKRLWIAIGIITGSYSCIMINVVNASYLIIDNLAISPLLFSVIFASNGLIMIIGNTLGIKLREYRSLTWNIGAGSLVMVMGSTVMVFLFTFYGLSLWSLAPLLVINLGVTFCNPPALSLALSEYTHQAGTATGLLNTVRMVFSSLIGGLVSIFITYNTTILPYSLLFCSCFCMLISMVCQKQKTA